MAWTQKETDTMLADMCSHEGLGKACQRCVLDGLEALSAIELHIQGRVAREQAAILAVAAQEIESHIPEEETATGQAAMSVCRNYLQILALVTLTGIKK